METDVMAYTAATVRPAEALADLSPAELAAQEILDAAHRVQRHMIAAADAAMLRMNAEQRAIAMPAYKAMIDAAREAMAGELDAYNARTEA